MSHLSETLNSKPSLLHYTLGGALFLLMFIFVFVEFRQVNLSLSPKNNLAALVPATVQPTAELTLQGVLPGIGTVSQVKVQGNYAYAAANTWGLVVIDLSNPAVPKLAGSGNAVFDGYRVTLSGRIAAVSGRRSIYKNGLLRFIAVRYFFDISNPALPILIGKIDTNDDARLEESSAGGGIAISGTTAFIATNNAAGLFVLDLSGLPTNVTPATVPVTVPVIGTWTDGATISSVDVSGGYAYVSKGLNLAILDVSNPRSPFLVTGGILPLGPIRDIAVVGNTAYVAEVTSLTLVDINTKSAPSVLGKYTTGSSAIVPQSVVVENNIAYVAAGPFGGVLAIDVSTPSAPSKKSQVVVGGGPTAGALDVAIAGSYAYVANSGGGLAVVGGANTTSPQQLTYLNEWFFSSKISTKPGLAVIVGTKYSENGTKNIPAVQFIDISKPTIPRLVATIDSNLYTYRGAAFSGNYAYLAVGTEGVLVYDISTPSNPTPVGLVNTPGFAWAIKIVGNYGYVADGSTGLTILDLTDPRNPSLKGSIRPGAGTANNVEISSNGTDTYAYLANGSAVYIIKVTNPAAPVTVGTHTMTGSQVARDIVVNNSIAYVAAASGLVVLNVANPASPVQIGSLIPAQGGPNASTNSVTIDTTHAYIANNDGGVGVVDISTCTSPSSCSPQYIYKVPSAEFVLGVVVQGDYLFSTDTLTGLVTYSLPPPIVAPPATYHPADTSRNYSIETSEALNYASCWKRLCTTANPPVPIPAFYLTAATSFWKRTGPYHYVSTPACTPTNPACFVVGP